MYHFTYFRMQLDNIYLLQSYKKDNSRIKHRMITIMGLKQIVNTIIIIHINVMKMARSNPLAFGEYQSPSM